MTDKKPPLSECLHCGEVAAYITDKGSATCSVCFDHWNEGWKWVKRYRALETEKADAERDAIREHDSAFFNEKRALEAEARQAQAEQRARDAQLEALKMTNLATDYSKKIETLEVESGIVARLRLELAEAKRLLGLAKEAFGYSDEQLKEAKAEIARLRDELANAEANVRAWSAKWTESETHNEALVEFAKDARKEIRELKDRLNVVITQRGNEW